MRRALRLALLAVAADAAAKFALEKKGQKVLNVVEPAGRQWRRNPSSKMRKMRALTV